MLLYVLKRRKKSPQQNNSLRRSILLLVWIAFFWFPELVGAQGILGRLEYPKPGIFPTFLSTNFYPSDMGFLRIQDINFLDESYERVQEDDLDSSYEIEFIISYQFSLKDEVPRGEKYSISLPLVKRDLSRSYKCDISNSLFEDFQDLNVLHTVLKTLLYRYKDEVLECLYRSGISVREDVFSNHGYVRNHVTLSLAPTFVKVSLHQGFMRLWVLKTKNELGERR